MAHRHQKVFADEEVGFTVFDFVVLAPLRGFDHDEQRIAVGLQLRPLVRAQRVFDRQIVQAELLLHLAHKRRFRLPEPQPDEGVRLFDHLADIVDGHFAQPLAGFVRHTVHHHAFAVHPSIH